MSYAKNTAERYGLISPADDKVDQYIRTSLFVSYGDVGRALQGTKSYYAAHIRALDTGIAENFRPTVEAKIALMKEVINRLETLNLIL